jgi:hypothetical protein
MSLQGSPLSLDEVTPDSAPPLTTSPLTAGPVTSSALPVGAPAAAVPTSAGPGSSGPLAALPVGAPAAAVPTSAGPGSSLASTPLPATPAEVAIDPTQNSVKVIELPPVSGSVGVSGNVGVANSGRSTYSAPFSSVDIPSGSPYLDLLAIESPESGSVRIRRIIFTQVGGSKGPVTRKIELVKTTSMGGGTVLTPGVHDGGDSAYSGIVRSGGGGIPATASRVAATIPLFSPGPQALHPPLIFEYPDSERAPTAVTGTSNGIALRDPGAPGGITGCSGWVEFTVE